MGNRKRFKLKKELKENPSIYKHDLEDTSPEKISNKLIIPFDARLSWWVPRPQLIYVESTAESVVSFVFLKTTYEIAAPSGVDVLWQTN